VPPQQAAACPASTIVPVAGSRDGQFEMLGDLSANRPADVSSFIVIGKEAAASGRPRDAEVAFLMACRLAEKVAQSEPLLLADSKYQLGWHYGNLARDSAVAKREPFVRRAEVLYADSLRVYTAQLGQAHEKSRFAANGLAALKQPAAQGDVQSAQAGSATRAPARTATSEAQTRAPAPQAAATTQAAAPPPAPSARPTPRAVAPPVPAATTARATPTPRNEPREDTRIAGAGPVQQSEEPGEKPRASFDCTKARSVPERLICADPQLAQLDRDLGRLYAQVKSGASNQADFRRRSDAEWRRRETSCRDKECLLAWYSNRRADLLDELQAQRGSLDSPTASR
jgi:hypothetical protein